MPEPLGDDVVVVDRLEVALAREHEVPVPERGIRVEEGFERDTHRVLDEARPPMGVLDDEQLVGALEKLVHRRAHRLLDDPDELLRVQLLRRADEQRPAPALVVCRDRNELEDPLDLVPVVAGVAEALGCPPPDEVLRARTGVDPRRLDADDTTRAGAVRGRHADERDHLLRHEVGDRRPPPERPARDDPHLGPERALALDDLRRDPVREDLDEEPFAEDGLVDRLVEELREARHVDALLPPGEVDGAVDLRRHEDLLLAAPDPDRLLHARDAGAREGDLDGRRGRLHVADERQVAHPSQTTWFLAARNGIPLSRNPVADPRLRRGTSLKAPASRSRSSVTEGAATAAGP